jgi:predicted Fe-Mo cluster-binding NifX family protein
MKVAVTVWGERISPVFDSSRRLLIAQIEKAHITERSYLIFEPHRPSHLANILTALDVKVLICGAVSQAPADVIVAGGITLIPFITGEVDRVLTTYAKGQSMDPDFVMPGCHDSLNRKPR